MRKRNQSNTFKSWGKEEIIGFEGDGNSVVAVWCKLCCKHIEKIKADTTLTGKAKEDTLNYTKKVTFVKETPTDTLPVQATKLHYLTRASPLTMATHQNEDK